MRRSRSGEKGTITRAGRTSASLLRSLNNRSKTGRSRGVELWAEDESVFRQQLEYLDLSEEGATRSTIAVAFSTDGKLLASTHGDHTVKITSFLRGKVVQTLRGHPRTPWTVKFHPKDSRIVASGCIGSEVRVWNVSTGQCMHTVALEAAIISLSFHPSGKMLAMASSLYVYLWDYNNKARPFIAWAHSHTLRCVRFTPGGDGIIVGAANSSSVAPSARNPNQHGAAGGGRAAAPATAPAPAPPSQPAEVTFRLQVWEFDLDAALAARVAAAMTRERVLLSQALLYNDGGFDVSQDGLWLCAIAGLRENPADAGGLSAVPPKQRAAVTAAAAALPSSSSATVVSAPATATATVVDVEEAETEEEEDAAAAAVVRALSAGGKTRAAGSVGDGCPGGLGVGDRRDTSGEHIAAPKNGSELGNGDQWTPPVTVMTSTACSADASTGSASGATIDSLAVVVGVERADPDEKRGSSQSAAAAMAVVSQAERRKGSALAPWPSRVRLRPYFSETFGEVGRGGPDAPAARGGRGRLASGTCVAIERSADAFRSDDAGHEPPPFTPPPFTPSPRISLKRGLSGSWLSATSGGRTGGGRGGGSGGNGGGFWGRELRRRGSPRSGLFDGRGGVGGAETIMQPGGRPPVLPPQRQPPLPTRALAGGSPHPSSPSMPAAPPSEFEPSLRPSPSLPTAGGQTSGVSVAGAATASASSSPASLRISLPLLLQPPPRPSESRLSIGGGAIGVSAEGLGAGGNGRQRQQQLPPFQEGEFSPPLPSQRLFFLQVPGRGITAGGVAARSPGQGVGWSAQFLSPGDAEGGIAPTAGAPTTYGRGRVQAGTTSTARVGSSHGGRDEARRQAETPGGAPAGEGGQRGGSARDGIGTVWTGGGSGGGGGGLSSFCSNPVRLSPLASSPARPGHFVPHLVLVSLNLGGRGSGGRQVGKAVRVVRAAPMDLITAKQVTSAKFSPSARYILLGVGVRGAGQAQHQAAFAPGGQGDAAAAAAPAAAGIPRPSQHQHSLSSIYRSADLQAVNSIPTVEEDVNIACFHPEPGMGCVYGTKQGRVGIVRMID